MSYRTTWFLGLAGGSLLALAACGDKESTTSTSGTSGGSGGTSTSTSTGGGGGTAGASAGGTGGAAGMASTGGAGGQASSGLACTIARAKHSNCIGECPITWDYLVTCDDDNFGGLGLGVAATSQDVFLAATSWDDTLLWSFDATRGEAVPGFPLLLNTSPIALGVAEDDTLHALGDETNGNMYAGGLALATLQGSEFEKSLVFDLPDRYTGYIDLALDADGSPHVWFASNPPDEQSLSRLLGDGSWSREVVEHPGLDWERFTLSDADEPVAFGLEPLASGGYTLLARHAGSDQALGSPFSEVGAPRYRPLDPPVPRDTSASSIDYAAIVEHAGGLRLAWSSGGEGSEREIPIAASEAACRLGFDFVGAGGPPCPETCHELRTSLEYQAFAATRGSQAIWVAYVLQHTDWDVDYAPQDIDGSMQCVGNVSEDRSTAELVVVEVALDAAEPRQVLSLPLASLGFDLATYTDTDAAPVAIHAYGDRIAVGVRGERAGSSEFRVLLLSDGG